MASRYDRKRDPWFNCANCEAGIFTLAEKLASEKRILTGKGTYAVCNACDEKGVTL